MGVASHARATMPYPGLASSPLQCGAYLLSQSFGFSFSVTDTNKIAEGEVLHAVASRTHLLVHLITSSDAVGRESRPGGQVMGAGKGGERDGPTEMRAQETWSTPPGGDNNNNSLRACRRGEQIEKGGGLCLRGWRKVAMEWGRTKQEGTGHSSSDGKRDTECQL